MDTDSVSIIGVAASVFTAISLLPQLIKIYRTQKAGDVSPLMLLALFTGLGLWVVYGCMKKDLIISISNGVSFVLNAWIGVLMWKYRE